MSRADLDSQRALFEAWWETCEITLSDSVHYVATAAWQAALAAQAPAVQQEPDKFLADLKDAADDLKSAIMGGASSDWLIGFMGQYPFGNALAAKAVAPSPQGDAEDAARLDALGSNKKWELAMDWDGEDLEWCVWNVVGSRSDREWREIGRGATPRAAIDAARKAVK